MSHTPGPWTYQPPPDDMEDGVVVAANGTYVAQTSYDGLSNTKAHDELADGRLIAVAPDLLRFATAVAEWHHDGLCPAGPINDGPCQCFVGLAERLVAKSTNAEADE